MAGVIPPSPSATDERRKDSVSCADARQAGYPVSCADARQAGYPVPCADARQAEYPVPCA